MPERKQTKYLTGGKHSNAEPRPNRRSLAEIPRIGLAHSIPDDYPFRVIENGSQDRVLRQTNGIRPSRTPLLSIGLGCLAHQKQSRVSLEQQNLRFLIWDQSGQDLKESIEDRIQAKILRERKGAKRVGFFLGGLSHRETLADRIFRASALCDVPQKHHVSAGTDPRRLRPGNLKYGSHKYLTLSKVYSWANCLITCCLQLTYVSPFHLRLLSWT
jgi:hypothetical protein